MEKQMTQNLDRDWLVKASGRILGPFTSEELRSLLRNRKISMIDEIRRPNAYWKFIREFPEFERALEDLREEESHTLDIATAELTDSINRTLTDMTGTMSDELTPEPVRIPQYEKQEIPTIISSPHIKAKPQLTVPPKGSHRGITLAVILAISMITFLVLNRSLLNSIQNRLGFEIGSSESEKLRKAELLLQKPGRQLEARRIFEEINLRLPTTNPLRADAQIGVGLSDLRDTNFQRAEEIFESVLLAYPERYEAKWDSVSSKIQRGDFTGASLSLQGLTSPIPAEKLLFALGQSLTLLGQETESSNPADFAAAFKQVSDLLPLSSDLRLEAHLLNATLAHRLGLRDEVRNQIDKLLSEDPDLTQEHERNLLLDHKLLDWDRLNSECEKLSISLGETPVSKTLSAYCHYQKKEIPAAFQTLEAARSQFSRDDQLMALSSYLLHKVQRDEAKTMANLSPESLLSMRVLAKTCEKKKDWECSEKHWKKILELKSNDVPALTGLALAAWERKDQSSAILQIKKALELSPQYRPALDFAEKINAR